MEVRRFSLKVGPFEQLVREFFGPESGLPSAEITAIAPLDDGSVLVGTAKGLSLLRKDGGVEVPEGVPSAKVLALHVSGKGRAWASLAQEGLWVLEGGRWLPLSGSPPDVVAIADGAEKGVWALNFEGLWRLEGERWLLVRGLDGAEGRDLALTSNGTPVVATNCGLWFLVGKRPHWHEVFSRPEGLLSNDVRAVEADRLGHLWIATDKGVCIFNGLDGWYRIRGPQGLPVEDVTHIALGPRGERWFGSPKGAMRLLDGEWKYFASKRWLPDDEVTALAAAPDGTAWVGTKAGLAKIHALTLTLEEKARLFERQVRERHVRHGYVTVRRLERPGDVESGRVEISDNDGLWTALYVAAESFRFAVTGEGEAKEFARQSLYALLRLEEVTGIPGFPARAIRHEGEPGFGEPHPEWHKAEDGKVEWKGDTSSDEIDGHFFAYSVYFDLVADEEEKGRIREAVKRITDHIIEHGYYLVDVDGKPTTWGVWAPERLNADERWWAERGLNSLEILSHLKVAHHITDEERYDEEYRKLALQHHYALNTIEQKITVPGFVNHSDDELAFLSYYPLLLYEDDPDLRAIYLMSLERSWRIERPERNPLWNVIYGVLTGKHCDIGAAVRTLKEIPLDLVHWTVRNSHRADVVKSPHPGRFGEEEAIEPLPFDERPLHKWNGNPYRLDGGAEGLVEEDATFYLLPYWMARYWGLIEG